MPQEVLVAPVASDDPEQKKNENKKLPADVEVVELSKADRELKEKLELFVERMQDPDRELSRTALNQLKDEIRSATASMTSVPKPLRFLQDYYENIKTYFDAIADATWRREVADLMSILGMVFEEPETRMCLKLRLESTPEIESWGAQYVKHLAAEIRMEMNERYQFEAESDEEGLASLIPQDQLFGIAFAVVEFYMSHNSEPEACDTLLEVSQLPRIVELCTEHNFQRVCQYLKSIASYQPYPEDIAVYGICHDISIRFEDYYGAMRFALRLDDRERVVNLMMSLKPKPLERKQVAFLLGWHQYGYEEESEDDEDDDDMDEDDEDEDDLSVNDIISNLKLHDAFHDLARELDVLEPKDPEVDVFKEHLSDESTQIVSARKQLAATYVNSFVNCGYGRDKYMVSGSENATDEASKWIYRNKDHGMMAAVASVGMIMLWDEDAVNAVDRYVEAPDINIRSGAFLAIGVACSGMRSDADLAYALLQSHVEGEKNETNAERVAAAFGLGLAYAGQAKQSIYEILWPLIGPDESLELSCVSALALSLVFVGTCDAEVSNLLLADLIERNAEDLDSPLLLLHVLGLGLLFLQRGEEVETTMAAVDAFEHINPKFARTVKTTLEVLAYAGTGNVLKVQQFMEIVGEHFDEEKKKDEAEEKKDDGGAGLRGNPLLAGGAGAAGGPGGAAAATEDQEEEKEVDDHRYFQSIATIGVAAVALGEELGVEMALRMFNHFIQYGNARVKRAVPLALALLSVSNPSITVADILSRLSHDHDDAIAHNAILGLGLIGAGTNNARIATMLRQLTEYYAKDANHLFLVRISQGLLFMGKGLMTLQPMHSDRFLLSKVAFGGILACLFSAIDLKNTILGSQHYLLFSLVLAMKPRMLVTLDEKMKQQKVTVRVGQALDVVGIAGKPKTITGFQTHESPVLLGYKDRAELATDEYLPLSSILEGFAIMKKNPDFVEDASDKKKKKK